MRRIVRTLGVLGLFGVIAAVAWSGGPASARPAAGTVSVSHGLTLYQESCASCHGQAGQGSQRGPTLIGVGEASADFYLQTGRMPLAQEKRQAEAGPRKFSEADIADLVAYVGSLGNGPAIPDVQPGSLTDGATLYLQNCASCHDASGAGYTQVGGVTAPDLLDDSATELAEAIRVGPSTMPRFPGSALSQEEVNSVVTYVESLQRPKVNRGGASIGRLGPVTETLVGFAVLGLLLVLVRLLGRRAA